MSKRTKRVALATCVLAAAVTVTYFAAANEPPTAPTETVAAQPVPAPAPTPATAPAPAPTPVKSEAQAVPAAAAGMMAFKDPVTGLLRQPEPGEVEALTGAARQSVAGGSGRARFAAPVEAQPFVAADGAAIGMKLGEESMSYSVVTKTPDGKLKADCVTGKKAAEAAVSGAQTSLKGALDVK